ncbi:TonB-dependent receptor [Acinetobacter puyangensis]|uniref:TonB-dependent receptor n=1 Tax=Acinetobacter puyangensis TaxID=1096779 RepID=UPI003A4DCC9E
MQKKFQLHRLALAVGIMSYATTAPVMAELRVSQNTSVDSALQENIVGPQQTVQSVSQQQLVAPQTNQPPVAQPETDVAQTVQAQTEADVVTLGEVVVTGSKKQTVVPTRDVSSVYGLNTTLLDTPRSVTQIDSETLANDVIRSADDLAKYAPGITRGGGQNNNFAPQIRGQNSEVFQDNQRIDSTRHPSNFNAYEGVDIVTGSAGIIYAPTSGSGGYANYITKKPDLNAEKSETVIKGTFGAWYEGKGYEPNYSLNIDHKGRVNETLAYRVSGTAQKNEDYYDNVKNDYNALYGALTWRPDDSLRIDWNISYDDYYDYNITHGWNRATQDSVDKGLYYKGRSTPIIQQSDGSYWSPVYASGAADSEVVGWQVRQKTQDNKYVAVGEVQTTALPSASADDAGTIRGWVYDPTIPGNEQVKLKDYISGRAEDKNSSTRFLTQLRIAKDIHPNWTIVNSTLYQNSKDKGNAVGSFLTNLKHEIFDNRLELQSDYDFQVGALSINHKTSSGATYRNEKFVALAANNSFINNPYDLTNNPSQKNPGDLLGLENNTGSTGGWIGTAGVPQYSRYFGYLKLPAMYSTGDGLYAEKGGFPTSGGAVYTGSGFWDTYSAFTQQNFVFNEIVGLNLGVNHSSIVAKLENPLVLTATDKRRDDARFSMLSYQASTYVKPTHNSTIYFTYDKSTSLNTGVFGPFLIWGPGNKINPLAFDSQSDLKEIGIKYEPIKDVLFLGLSGFHQARDQSPDTNGEMARLKIKGLESSLRWQIQPNIATGLNLTVLDAVYTSITPSGFSPYGFVADNETVFGDSNGLNQRAAGRYPAAGIPKYSVSAFLQYEHDSGLGFNLSGWWSSDWYTNLSHTVKVPNSYNFDLGLFYKQPRWSVGLNLLNLTDERNFVNGLAGSTSEFLQPMRPFTVQGQFNYTF